MMVMYLHKWETWHLIDRPYHLQACAVEIEAGVVFLHFIENENVGRDRDRRERKAVWRRREMTWLHTMCEYLIMHRDQAIQTE